MLLKNKLWPVVGEGIDDSLLQDKWIPAPWINLGDWSVTDDYREACHQLAFRLGDRLELKADDRLLELACGYGAGLRLWSKSFGVQHCDALEYRRECHDFNYDLLVTNPQKEIKLLINWLNWEWDDKYLYSHKNNRSVSTASSVQVRSPINKKSINGWKNYKEMLKPAIKMLKEDSLVIDKD